jgi:cell division protein FtsB
MSKRRLRNPQEDRERRKKVATYGLLFLATAFMANAVVGEHGYLATLAAGQEKQAIEARIAALDRENQELRDMVARLDSDPSALEETARRDLNMIKPGETLIILKDESVARLPTP